MEPRTRSRRPLVRAIAEYGTRLQVAFIAADDAIFSVRMDEPANRQAAALARVEAAQARVAAAQQLMQEQPVAHRRASRAVAVCGRAIPLTATPARRMCP